MKIKFAVMICLLLTMTLFAQKTDEVGVQEVYLARDNGSGKAGETTQSFLTTDIPIHCIVQLDSVKPVTVKMVFIAAKVDGVKAESKVFTSKYTTNGAQTQVSFIGKPDKNWTAGNYRIDIFLEDKKVKSLEFDILKSFTQVEKKAVSAPKVKNFSSKKFRKG